jgi:Acetyltransferase (GNAT) domain
VSFTARLIDDLGVEAADVEFFRSLEFFAAEGVTHTLAIGDARRLPVIVRAIEGEDRFDAVSPYGYPGASGPLSEPPDPATIDWSGTGLVSVFVRDMIGESRSFSGGTVRNVVQIADGAGGIRKRLREQIRRNERQGWEIRFATGPEDAARLEAFMTAYDETMARTGAAERYLYPSDYFETLLKGDGSWLLTAEREGVGLAGAFAVLSDGYLHYYLGGTADEALGESPMKNLFAAMIELGGELGAPVNLGGGLSPGDSLEDFKRGFATEEQPFRTHELVADLVAYEELVGRAAPAPEGFFPAYRS